MNNRHVLFICIILSFLLGVLGMWVYQTHANQRTTTHTGLMGDVFEAPFFDRSDSPFAEIERLHKQLDNTFGRQDGFPGFGQWFVWRDNPGSFASIQTEEDGHHIIFILDLDGKEVANFKIETSEGYISIDAELEANKRGSSFSQTIKQQFPIPTSVNPDTLHVEQLDDEIRMRFDKLG